MVSLEFGSGPTKARGYIGSDLEPYTGLDFIADAQHPPIRDGVARRIFTDQMLEHLSEPSKFIRESHRILKESGILLISVPNTDHLRRTLRFMIKNRVTVTPDHVYAWGLPELKQFGERFGFSYLMHDVRTHERHHNLVWWERAIRAVWKRGVDRNLIMKFVKGEGPGFWEKRYAEGGDSGKGSRGRRRRELWRIIDETIPELKEVLDLGCGDLMLWGDRRPEIYVGVDKSPTIIDRNRELWPGRTFFVGDIANLRDKRGISFETVFLVAVLYHVELDEDYVAILENACRFSSRYIVITTWTRSPWANKTDDGCYQFYREFMEYQSIFTDQGFNMILYRPLEDGVGAVYIYERGGL